MFQIYNTFNNIFFYCRALEACLRSVERPEIQEEVVSIKNDGTLSVARGSISMS